MLRRRAEQSSLLRVGDIAGRRRSAEYLPGGARLTGSRRGGRSRGGRPGGTRWRVGPGARRRARISRASGRSGMPVGRAGEGDVVPWRRGPGECPGGRCRLGRGRGRSPPGLRAEARAARMRALRRPWDSRSVTSRCRRSQEELFVGQDASRARWATRVSRSEGLSGRGSGTASSALSLGGALGAGIGCTR